MPSGREWFRLYNRMTQDPKVQHLNDYEFRFVIHIWCLASESSERGVVFVAPGVGYEPEILARGAGCRNGDPIAALGTLQKMQLIKVDDDGVIYIQNWDKLQYEYDSWKPEARRNQKAKERSRKKQEGQQSQGVGDDANNIGVNVSQACRKTDTDTDTDTDTEIKNNMCDLNNSNSNKPENNTGEAQQNTAGNGNNDVPPAEKPAKRQGTYETEFEQFWFVYPRRVEKQGAYKAWIARLKEGVTPDILINASQNYAISCRENGIENRFIKHAKTFLGPSKPYEDYVGGPLLNNHRAPPIEPKGFQALREYIEEEGIH